LIENKFKALVHIDKPHLRIDRKEMSFGVGHKGGNWTRI